MNKDLPGQLYLFGKPDYNFNLSYESTKDLRRDQIYELGRPVKYTSYDMYCKSEMTCPDCGLIHSTGLHIGEKKDGKVGVAGPCVHFITCECGYSNCIPVEESSPAQDFTKND